MQSTEIRVVRVAPEAFEHLHGLVRGSASLARDPRTSASDQRGSARFEEEVARFHQHRASLRSLGPIARHERAAELEHGRGCSPSVVVRPDAGTIQECRQDLLRGEIVPVPDPRPRDLSIMFAVHSANRSDNPAGCGPAVASRAASPVRKTPYRSCSSSSLSSGPGKRGPSPSKPSKCRHEDASIPSGQPGAESAPFSRLDRAVHSTIGCTEKACSGETSRIMDRRAVGRINGVEPAPVRLRTRRDAAISHDQSSGGSATGETSAV